MAEQPVPAPTLAEFEAVDEALAAALDRNLLGLSANLALEQSVALHRLLRPRAAATYIRIAADAWQMHVNLARTLPEPEALLGARILNLSALQHFMLGDFATAQDHLSGAARLTDGLEPSLISGYVRWTRSLLERWRNLPHAALDAAQPALDVFSQLAPPSEQARLHLHIANMTLDLASTVSGPDGREPDPNHFNLARMHLEHAHPPAGSRYESAVHGIYCLTYVRYSRLTGQNEDRVKLIESVIRQAAAERDYVVCGQALTALGDELMSQAGRQEEGLTRHRAAADILLRGEAPVLAAWSLRPLKRDWEYHVTSADLH